MNFIVFELSLDLWRCIFVNSCDGFTRVRGISEGVSEVNDLVLSFFTLTLDHDICWLDVPVIVAHFLHFSKEPDHFLDESPHLRCSVWENVVLEYILNFLVQSFVTELHDDAGLDFDSFVCFLFIVVVLEVVMINLC